VPYIFINNFTELQSKSIYYIIVYVIVGVCVCDWFIG